MELHTQPFHALDADRSDIRIKHRQHPVQRLHNGDLRTEGGIGAGQLQPYNAAAYGYHGFRQLLKAQCARGIYAAGVFPYAGNGRHGVYRARGDNYGVGRHSFLIAVRLRYLDGFGGHKNRLAIYPGYPVQPEKPRHP